MASIRIAHEPDADEIAAIYRPWVERTAVSFELEPPSGSDMSQRMAALGSYAPWLVCAGPDGVWGYAYASKHRDRAAYQWSVDVAVYVREDRRGRGAGAARITQPTAASVALHEALGFRRIATYPAVGFKLGTWHDVGWWQCRLREAPRNPGPPIPVAVAQQRREWEAALRAGLPFLR